MNAIVSAAPLANLLGIQDLSGRPPVIEPEMLPTHLPHVYLYCEKGPTKPEMVSGDALAQLYGTKTLDTRSPYFNHQSLLANTVLGEGGSLMVQRILPQDAGPRSRLLLSIEIVEDEIATYERNADGSFKIDGQTGLRIPTGNTITGHKARWKLNDWTAGSTVSPFGAVPKKSGLLENAIGEQATVIPILEFEAAWQGAYGNNLGVRLTAPHGNSIAMMNTSVANQVKSYLYRLQLVSRADPSLSAQVTNTLYGEPKMDFSFKPGALNTRLDTELEFTPLYFSMYEDVGTPGMPKTHAPFKRVHVYQDNLEEVLEMIGAMEAPLGLLPEATMDASSEYLYHVNPFTGTDFEGVPYHTLEILGVADGGLLFSDSSTFYAEGGSDGTMNDQAFDLAVRSEVLVYGQGEAPLLDWALYPQSAYYDTGFELDTKYAYIGLLGKRKDIWVALTTQVGTETQNSESEDSSVALNLMSYARNYPESEMYGTPVCRAMVFAHSGYLLNSKYKKLTPVIIEFAQKCAAWMSAGNGIWEAGMGFDFTPQNQVRMFRLDTLNIGYKDQKVRNRDWANGMIWIQNYDRRSAFWPAFQTVYNDDSSVLNSAINMMIAVDLEKVALRTWRDLTGISGLTDLQFIDRSDRLINDQVRGKYDGRVVIVPETYYTPNDVQRGYSWSCKIHMYAPNMKTVGTYTITAHRLSDLVDAA